MSNAINTATEIHSSLFVEINEHVFDLTNAEAAQDHDTLLAGYLRREISKRTAVTPKVSYEITLNLCQLVDDDAIVLASITGTVPGMFDSDDELELDRRERHALVCDSYFQG